MAVHLSFNVGDMQRADKVFFAMPIREDELCLQILYREFLYKSTGLQEDLYTLLKNKNHQLSIEGLLFDELDFILDQYVLEMDQVFRKRVKEEFKILSGFVLGLANRYPLYNAKGEFIFQSVDFLDSTTLGFFKIAPFKI